MKIQRNGKRSRFPSKPTFCLPKEAKAKKAAKFNPWDRWIYPLPKETDTVFCSAVIATLQTRGEYSEHIGRLALSGKIREAVEFPVSVKADLEDYRAATQIQALFKKNLDVDLGYNPLRAGVEAFIKAELQCQETNRFFGLPAPFTGVLHVITRARRKIAAALGPVPALNRLKPRLGPGASTTIPKARSCFENKLSGPIVCSESLLPSVNSFLAETPSWTRHHSGEWSRGSYPETELTFEEEEFLRELHGDEADHFIGEENRRRSLNKRTVIESHAREVPVVIDVGKLLFVEKNAKTHRPIVVEPCLNGFWQLGVGDYIKDRLRVHCNQDLRDQERNRSLARRGSIDGSIATVDLSSASDTIAYSVVYDLLPEPWVDLLDKLRTPVIEYEGCQIELEKFSSMGNGFTFELESLLFWALASACTELSGGDQQDVSVYGDDIIVPSGAVELLYASLAWCGFWVNPDKSFHQGPFRESCGADWLNGDDVRPIFKKDRLSLQWLFLFHNWSMRAGERSLADIAKAFIPKAYQIYGPDGYGDGHLLGSYDLKTTRLARRRGYGGGWFTTLRETPTSTKIDDAGALLYALYDTYVNGHTDWLNPAERREPGTTPGSLCVERTSIYTFAEHIFIR